MQAAREVVRLDLQLSFHLYGCAPVQAEGEVAGHRFYFRARGDAWTFGVARTPDVDPVDVFCPEHGFFRGGDYGSDEFDASYMPFDDAEAIVCRCAAEFIAGIEA